MVKLSNILITLALIPVLAFGMIFFLAEGTTQYGENFNIPEGANDSFFEITGIAGNLSQDLNTTSNELAVSSQGNQVGDFLGFFFNAGFKAARIASNSLQLLNSIVDLVLENMGVGSTPFGEILKVAATSIILIIIIVAILMHFITKSDRN